MFFPMHSRVVRNSKYMGKVSTDHDEVAQIYLLDAVLLCDGQLGGLIVGFKICFSTFTMNEIGNSCAS